MDGHKEFEDFSVHFLNEDRKFSSGEPIEGYVRLVVNPNYSNKVRDVCINCLGYSRFSVAHDFGPTEHGELKRFYNETQRSACQFDHGGIPDGVYEFPFSFDIPRSSSSTIKFERHQFGLIVFRGTIAYQITALLLNEGDSIQEPTLRATATFTRYVVQDPSFPTAPLLATEFAEFEGCEAEISAEIPKAFFEVGEVAKVSIRVKYLNPKYWVKRVSAKLVQSSDLLMERENAPLCEVSNRHRSSEVTIYPDYNDVRLVSRSRNESVSHLYDLEGIVPISRQNTNEDLILNSLSKNIIPTLNEDSVMKDSDSKTFHLDVHYHVQVDVYIAKSTFMKSQRVTLNIPVDLFLSKESVEEDIGVPRYYSEIALAKYTRNEDDLRAYNESKVTDLERLRKRTFFYMSSTLDGSGTNEQFFQNLNGESSSGLGKANREERPDGLEESGPGDGASDSNDSSFVEIVSQSIPTANFSDCNRASSTSGLSTAMKCSLDRDTTEDTPEDDPPPSYSDVINGTSVYNKIQMNVDLVRQCNGTISFHPKHSL